MKIIGLIGLILLGSPGVGHSSETPRVKLSHFGDIVVADFNQGQVPTTRKFNPATQELEFHLDLLIRNASLDKSQPLLIRGAQYHAEKETFGVECRDLYRSTENLNLKPGMSVRLDCIVRLVATARNSVAETGSNGFVMIPYDNTNIERSLRIPVKINVEAFSP